MENEQIFLDMMINALKLLSYDYQRQLDSLPAFVHVPDEIALNFDDAYRLFDQVIDASLVNNEQIQIIEEINLFLSKINETKEDSFWTLDALQSNEKWEKLRCLAKEALMKFNKSIDGFNLNRIVYIPGKH